jgi:hypothetical protein
VARKVREHLDAFELTVRHALGLSSSVLILVCLFGILAGAANPFVNLLIENEFVFASAACVTHGLAPF